MVLGDGDPVAAGPAYEEGRNFVFPQLNESGQWTSVIENAGF